MDGTMISTVNVPIRGRGLIYSGWGTCSKAYSSHSGAV